MSALDDFVNATQKQAQRVLSKAKPMAAMASKLSTPVDDEDAVVVKHARALASATHELVSSIDAYTRAIQLSRSLSMAEERMHQHSISVRQQVLDLVNAVRSAKANSLDFLSQQRVKNSLFQVNEHVRGVVRAADALRAERRVNELSSGVPTLNLLSVKRDDDDDDANSLTSSGRRSARESIDMISPRTQDTVEVVERAKNAKECVELLELALFPGEREKERQAGESEQDRVSRRHAVINTAAKEMASAALSLIQLAKHRDQNLAKELKSAAFDMISATKPLVKKSERTSETSRERMDNGRHEREFQRCAETFLSLVYDLYVRADHSAERRVNETLLSDSQRSQRSARGSDVMVATPQPEPRHATKRTERADSDGPSRPPPLPPGEATNPEPATVVASLSLPTPPVQEEPLPTPPKIQVQLPPTAAKGEAPPKPPKRLKPRFEELSEKTEGDKEEKAVVLHGAPKPMGLVKVISTREARTEEETQEAIGRVIGVFQRHMHGFNALWTEMEEAQRGLVQRMCVEAMNNVDSELEQRDDLHKLMIAESGDDLQEIAMERRVVQRERSRRKRRDTDPERPKMLRQRLMTISHSPLSDEQQTWLEEVLSEPTECKRRLQLIDEHFEDTYKQTMSVCLNKYTDSTLQENAGEEAKLRALAQTLMDLFASVCLGALQVVGSRNESATKTIADHRETIADVSVTGMCEEVVRQALAKAPKTARTVYRCTLDKTAQSGVALHRMCSQLWGELSLLSSCDEISLCLQIAATAESCAQRLHTLLCGIQTCLYARERVLRAKERRASDISHILSADDEADDNVHIWDEVRVRMKNASLKRKSYVNTKEMFAPASLNELVLKLTDPKEMDNRFMQTFVTTYRSFTEPSTLFAKLLERYDVPDGIDDKETIRLRVCVVLKYWLSNQFDDFDENTIDALEQFVHTRLRKDGQTAMSDLLTRVLESKRGTRADASFADVSKRLRFVELDTSPVQLLLHVPASDIAEQLTRIDYKLFVRIRPYELLSQAWNSKTLKYRAFNVLAVIARANHISFWTASQILWLRAKADRAKMISKFLEISEHLLRLHNYSTLMALFAGLNMSCVHRLKHTFELVPKELLSVRDRVQRLLAPTSSYKALRQAWGAASTEPCLPYLGVFLTDLTFMEDGNPDLIKSRSKITGKQTMLINMKKRQMVYETLSTIQLFQQRAYKIPKLEPLHTLLEDMPHCDEEPLYALSMYVEPRGAKHGVL